MSFAAPVSKEGFWYNGDLYVEVGGLNRHKRAPVAEITAILRPDLKISKAATVQPSKDPVGHWYEAQLMHYGLPPSKDKARAKMRLLEAVNSSNLVVPLGISRLEESLRKEFNAAEKKAKAQYKLQSGGERKDAANPRKRKQPDSAPNVNVTVNFNGMDTMHFGEIPSPSVTHAPNPTEQQLHSPSKKAKATPKKDCKIREATIKTKAPQTASNKKALAAKDPITKKPSSTTEAVTAKPGKTGAQKEPTVKKQPAAKKEPPTKKEPTVQKESMAKKEPTVKKESMAKKEPTVKKESMAKKEPTVKKESMAEKTLTVKEKPAMKKETTTEKQRAVKAENLHSYPSASNVGSLGLINGLYNIECPTMREQFSDNFDPDSLSLILTLDGPRIWGAYDFGQYSGVLLLENRPYSASNEALPVKWRGRENGEGEMSFGDHCYGDIAFHGNGRITGMLNFYGDCGFSGTRQPGPGTALRPAASMKEEWGGYNDSSYSYEASNRW